jgi:PAS domain S-box-containing protein
MSFAPEGSVDAVNVALQLAFIAIFLVVLIQYIRQPRVVHRDLVLVFGTVVVLFALGITRLVWPDLPTAISQLGTIVLLLQPYLTLRLAAHFVPVSRRVSMGALAALALATAAVVVGIRGNPALTLFVVGYFVVVEAIAAFQLLRAGERRVGYARTRLRIASGATFLFAAGILVAGGGAAVRTPTPADPTILVLARLLTLAAGIGYLAAFLPPMALRRLQQRAVAFDLGQSLLSSTPDGDQDRIWVALAQAARLVTNGPASAVALGDPPVVRIVSGDPPGDVAVGGPFSVPAVEARADRDDPAAIVVPIESELARQGWLVAYPDVESLFIDDDIVLLGLLAAQAARANERREAIRQSGVLAIELEDASQELATSRAQLESEARFRAALEAHPGILIVVEPGGRIGYANGQALKSLGYTAKDIRRCAFEDVLIRREPTADHPATGQARRRDGSTFPVEYAISSFEAQGEQAWLAVITDITARIETDHLRTTFIGILSHELRTPVTAIYGGSQILLSRADRLDPGTTNELLTDIAAEAERLHRLIENLLVLARVERGEDIAGGEPVLLQHVLPSIVERERELWLGTDISVAIPPGLPTVRGHDAYVGQVIRNLLSNAIKYGGPGSAVRIVAERAEAGVAIRVLDDGPGLDGSDMDHLFDLYYRAPGAALAAPGAGIGLFVCRQIVDALGGTIWARSRPEGGAEFGFRLPIYEADDEPAPAYTDRGELATAS